MTIRKSAEGEQCTMNSPICNYDKATVVLCHLNEYWAGKGKGIKGNDLHAFFGCSACHDLYDRRTHLDDEVRRAFEEDKYFYLLKAVCLTHERLLEKGDL